MEEEVAELSPSSSISSSSSVLFLGTLEELELADAEAPIPPTTSSPQGAFLYPLPWLPLHGANPKMRPPAAKTRRGREHPVGTGRCQVHAPRPTTSAVGGAAAPQVSHQGANHEG